MIRILELFGGIGACSKALERLGIEHEIVDAVEIDKYAVKSFNAIHNTNFEPQDICEWDKDMEVDLIMHGSPCQDFSLAGLQKSGDKGSGTRSSLMWETIRIVEKLKPKYVIWENVKNLLSKKHRHNFDTYLETMEQLGYANYYQVLNAKDYGIPQNRERVFTVSILGNKSFEFPPKQELKLKLKDMLEDEVDEKYYLNNKQIEKIIYGGYINSNFCCQKNVCYGLYSQQSKRFIQNPIKEISLSMKANKYDAAILIKNATQKKYQEGFEGDSVNLAYPDSKTRRGRVGSQVAQTLTTSDSIGVIVGGKK